MVPSWDASVHFMKPLCIGQPHSSIQTTAAMLTWPKSDATAGSIKAHQHVAEGDAAKQRACSKHKAGRHEVKLHMGRKCSHCSCCMATKAHHQLFPHLHARYQKHPGNICRC